MIALRRQPRPTTTSLVEESSEVRSAILKFLLTGLVVLLAVSIPAAFWMGSVAQKLAKQEVLQLTQRLADYAIGPILTTGLIAGEKSAVDQIDTRMAPWMSDELILRIKVWDAGGTILYSDKHDLIGTTFPLEPWASKLLAGGPGVISMGPQDEGENTHESGGGDLVEVYTLAGNGAEPPLLFEMYFHDEIVRVPEKQMVLGMIPVFLVTLGVLQAAQLIPGIRLAKRVQRYQRARRALLQQAIEAGEQERARLAGALHDDIIQDLAGLSYELDSVVPADGSVSPGKVLQGSIRKLREVTSELYPRPLKAAELPSALEMLVERARSHGIRMVVEIEEPVSLGDGQATMLYRVGREALVNVIKHAKANNVQLCLKPLGKQWRMQITDDGQGFDVLRGGEEAHFGLKMMSDTAESTGAKLELESALDGGTRISVTTGHRI